LLPVFDDERRIRRSPAAIESTGGPLFRQTDLRNRGVRVRPDPNAPIFSFIGPRGAFRFIF
jgi:hypothetical protein